MSTPGQLLTHRGVLPGPGLPPVLQGQESDTACTPSSLPSQEPRPQLSRVNGLFVVQVAFRTEADLGKRVEGCWGRG